MSRSPFVHFSVCACVPLTDIMCLLTYRYGDHFTCLPPEKIKVTGLVGDSFFET